MVIFHSYVNAYQRVDCYSGSKLPIFRHPKGVSKMFDDPQVTPFFPGKSAELATFLGNLVHRCTL